MKANTVMQEMQTTEAAGESIHSLSKFFVSTIMRHNQHVTMMTVGRTGTGKSYANLRLAYDCARELARRKGGKWQDYFSLDNVAVIEIEHAFEMLLKMKKHQIYIFDDIGVGWNARKWKDEGNQALNDIFQTFRTENCILLMTLPDTFLIDKVPRSGVHYFMEMEASYFDKGFTMAKFFRTSRLHRANEIHYIYPRHQVGLGHGEHVQYVRYVFPKPPEELLRSYDRLREEAAKALIQQRLEELRNSGGNGNKNKAMRSKGEILAARAHNLIYGEGMEQEKACTLLGISSKSYRTWRKRKNWGKETIDLTEYDGALNIGGRGIGVVCEM